MKLFICLGLLATITLASFKLKENTQKVKDYFSIPGPIEYSKTKFDLSWSAHPSDTYYKQEYIPANENPESFNKMIMIEAVVGEVSLPDAVKSKMDELEQRKKSDPITNYQLIKNPSTGEYLLDFVIGQGTGARAIVEWNAYRYADLKNKAGIKGVLLFAYSRRSYGNQTTGFLASLKTGRVNDINTLGNYKIPAVKIVGE